ncbi:hypothetical protein GQF61_05120 [Sphingobacterium sp. DK4209]|uniref:Fibrobacter succinogenes major paralogous domain-containing protein n=1 Tax=Sphingobacterium zhuxiongii TaxID=2662364 RepID=A0A5Q0QBC0_9SPHI|nr:MULTISPECIES: FISUMP domain-containing protein [unclassified Sphingobacterium]MVZ65225.1 hypothetical protein [Sphingobacterium sp. DK4209]QGA26171.1 hypothetical protein GFH32_07450 [Sphingobacterium sp. dk4302]
MKSLLLYSEIKISTSNLIKIASIMLVVLMGTSCQRKETDEISRGDQAVVTVSLKDAVFNGDEKLEPSAKASVDRSNKTSVHNTANISETQLGDDLILVAELKEVKNSTNLSSSQMTTSGNAEKAASTIERNQLIPGTRYKVVVFGPDRKYVTERDYAYGSEASTAALKLDGDKKYTFIAYSVNSTSILPAVTFADASNKTLDNSSVNGVTSSNDLMYFSTELTVSGNNSNYLSIVFKHRFSQITTIIDASVTGYTISAINANLSPQYTASNLKLADGSLTRTGTAGNATLSFSGLNTSILTSAPILINSETTSGTLTLSSITIGPLNKTSTAAALSGLVIKPGVKYNLTLSITPTDGYVGDDVRINGVTWSRRNLSVANTVTPDQAPGTSQIFGNYYQFGSSLVVAAPTATVTNTNWKPASQPNNSWNLGTELAPVKTSNDPCPVGYRVPTRTEFQRLIDATVHTDVGTWTKSNTNYSAAKVLTSKRNKSIKLTFPAQGFFGTSVEVGTSNYISLPLDERGVVGVYWTSTILNTSGVDGINYLRFVAGSPAFINYVQPTNSTKPFSMNIRCVKY